MGIDVLVVGAGFSGSVMARRLAEAGRQIVLYERRPHVAGNAFDELDAHGIRIHRYGPHLFHTNSQAVFDFLSRFTEWHPYEHHVMARLDGRYVPMPINVDTINQLYGLDLDEAGIQAFLERVREKRMPIRTSEDVVLNAVGRDLCDKFFRGYTRKQWGLDLSELDAAVAARVPARTNRDARYFTDTYQALPSEGFTAMFEQMLHHPNIRVEVGVAYSAKTAPPARLTVYTGSVDEYFGSCLGKLPYRSLRFQHEHLSGVTQFQPVGTVNYPDENIPYTRITEFKHLYGQVHSGTSIVREFPTSEGDPYYPVPRPENKKLHEQYAALAAERKDVVFVGRLAQYRYYNMDQAAAAALRVSAQLI